MYRTGLPRGKIGIRGPAFMSIVAICCMVEQAGTTGIPSRSLLVMRRFRQLWRMARRAYGSKRPPRHNSLAF